jgi:hypothetical protein
VIIGIAIEIVARGQQLDFDFDFDFDFEEPRQPDATSKLDSSASI